MTWSIRSAELCDVPRLASFAALLFRQAYGVTHPEPTLSEYLAASFAEARVAQAVMGPASTTLLVQSSDGTWVGYAELQEGGPRAPTTVLDTALPGAAPLEIVRFYVDRAWHGRGVAQALMRACEETAGTRGCDALWLQAWQQASQALRFYAKAGFQPHGTAVFTFGERADADVILARPLGASWATPRQTAG